MRKGEWIKVQYEESYVLLEIRLRKSLWEDIKKKAKRGGYDEVEYIYEALVELAAFGLTMRWILEA